MPQPVSHLSNRLSGHTRILIVLLAVGILARLLSAVQLGGATFRFVDEAIYADAAARLLSGEHLAGVAADLPGYPAFLALVDLFLPDGVLALRLGQAFAVAFGAVLCYLLGRRLGGESAGLAAAGIYSLDPLLVASAGLLYPETPAALLLTGGVLAAWDSGRSGRRPSALVAGVLLGGLTLFRAMGLTLAPAVGAWIGISPGVSPRRRLELLALLVAGWALVTGPWLWRNYRVYGDVLPAGAVAVGGVPGVGSEAPERGVGVAIVRAVERDPMAFARRTVLEFGYFWEPYPMRLATDDPARRAGFSRQDPRLSDTPLVRRSARDIVSALSFGLELALAGIGLAVGWRERRRETVWLVVLVLSFALGYALFFGKLRYRIPVLPIVFGFAGVGMATGATWLGRNRPGVRAGSVARPDP